MTSGVVKSPMRSETDSDLRVIRLLTYRALHLHRDRPSHAYTAI